MQEESLKSMDSSFDDKNLNNTKEEKDNKPSIKILVGYHKPAVLLKDEILTPIHLGRALATEASKDGKLSKQDYEWLCENMIGDDTGDNISHLNRYFCELTGIYWAWKNYDKLGNPDYIGFMHYRRQFLFKEGIKLAPRIWINYSPTYEFADKHYMDITDISNFEDIYSYEMILPEPLLYSNMGCNNLRMAYIRHMHDDKLLLDLEKIILNNDKYKEYQPFAKEFYKKEKSYPCNMFIMKKDLFFEYCDFLFDLSFDLYSKFETKLTNGLLSLQHSRGIAMVGECITDIFIEYSKSKHVSFKEFPVSFLKETDIIKDIKEEFKEQINICFYCNIHNSPYVSVSINSILSNCVDDKKYHVFILEEELPSNIKKLFKTLEKPNFRISFLNIKAALSNIDFEINKIKKFNMQTYYKFFIPRIFKNFNKIVCLDCNTIVLDDISKLYALNIRDSFIAACTDILVCSKEKKYLNDVLKIKNTDTYANTSVLVFNIPKCLNFDFENKALIVAKDTKCFKFVEADIFNKMLPSIKFIDSSYNVSLISDKDQQYHVISKMLDIYKRDLSKPKIICFNEVLPFHNVVSEKADIWWHYARKTPFYEDILYKALANPYKAGAKNQIQSHLSYKLGQELMSVKKNKAKILLLPLSLIFIYITHLLSRVLNHLLAYSNASIRPEPLHNYYSDYKEALKIKNYLTYKLGNTLVKHPFAFLFRVSKVYKEWKREREENL